MNGEMLPKVQMPNRKSFPASDDVYLFMKKRGCAEPTEIVSASDLDSREWL
jgi:hypothetical protein